MENNDIKGVGSEGIFENLYDTKVIELLKPFIRTRDEILDPGLVAEIIAVPYQHLTLADEGLGEVSVGPGFFKKKKKEITPITK